MSDSDAGDDEGIDKEALREELREKYERDEQEREATQRMSDLLLKGATMTNAHCGTCGDPLFQQDGTTFCPSCHGRPEAVEGTEVETAAEVADEGASPDDTDGVPAEDATGTSGPATGAGDAVGEGGDPSSDAPRNDVTRAGVGVSPDEDQRTPGDRPATDRVKPTDAASSDPERTRPTSDSDRSSRPSPPRDASSAATSAAGDREAARDSLVRALEKFAAEAAATDDPRYARECLEAAREASETLNTLR